MSKLARAHADAANRVRRSLVRSARAQMDPRTGTMVTPEDDGTWTPKGGKAHHRGRLLNLPRPAELVGLWVGDWKEAITALRGLSDTAVTAQHVVAKGRSIPHAIPQRRVTFRVKGGHGRGLVAYDDDHARAGRVDFLLPIARRRAGTAFLSIDPATDEPAVRFNLRRGAGAKVEPKPNEKPLPVTGIVYYAPLDGGPGTLIAHARDAEREGKYRIRI